MCGVVGFLQPALRRDTWEGVLKAMTDSLAHRGPDDHGQWVDAEAGVGLGHRRLAILDLSAQGHQPMCSKSARYYLTYNGEIYNHETLRRQLEACGVTFTGHSDTEVLLAALEVWGVETAVRRCRGMFAFALWDRQECALHLVRDGFGIKPLYYSKVGHTVIFASELSAFRRYPHFQAEIDRNALVLLLRHNAIPAPYCIYKGVAKQRPGTIVTFRVADNGGEPVTTTYWSLKEVVQDAMANPFAGGEEEAIGELHSLLQESVGLQMIADVPVGVFLSGGVDSSTLAALMQEKSGVPVRTFTIGFKEDRWNEAQYARQVAEHLGTEHTEYYVTPRDALRVISRLPEVYGEPFADSSQIPTFLISKIARRDVTVSLAGDGADELFGGYEHHRFLLRRYDQTGWLVDLFDRIGKSSPNYRRVLSEGLQGLAKTPCQRLGRFGQRMAALTRLLDSEKRPNFFLEQVSCWKDPAALVVDGNEPPTVMTDPAQWAFLKHFTAQAMFLDQMLYLPDVLLTKVDRASMHVGLELRVPYLDSRLVAFAWSLPLSWNVDRNRGKKLLRRVLYRYVPAAIVDRPKMGFSLPLAEWLRGDLREWGEALLDTRRLQQEGFFRPGPIRQAWNEHVSGTFPGRHNYLWSVLMFQAWLEHNHH